MPKCRAHDATARRPRSQTVDSGSKQRVRRYSTPKTNSRACDMSNSRLQAECRRWRPRTRHTLPSFGTARLLLYRPFLGAGCSKCVRRCRFHSRRDAARRAISVALSRQKRSPSVKVAIVHTYVGCARGYCALTYNLASFLASSPRHCYHRSKPA